LILDEPTSDLDSDTIAALEQYLLEEFKGVLVVVSHDRYFTDKVTDHLFILEGDGAIVDYSGSLSAYAETLVTTTTSVSDTYDNHNTREQMAIPKKEDKEKRTAKMNLRQKYTREMASLEQALEKLKAKSAALLSELDKSTNDGWSVLADLTEKISLVTDEIIEKENRWLELAEFLEQDDIN
jgi:ATP-binding cassette subfamily F protein uup